MFTKLYLLSLIHTFGPPTIIFCLDNDFFWQGEMKLKETYLETSTNSFLEKEKDLQNKIEELENRVEELNQISSFQKVCDFVCRIVHCIV